GPGCCDFRGFRCGGRRVSSGGMRIRSGLFVVTVVGLIAVVAPTGSGAAAVRVAATIRVSLTSTGGQAEGGSSVGVVLATNADGRDLGVASEGGHLGPGGNQ